MCHQGATACVLEVVTLSVDLRKGGDNGRERDKVHTCTMDHTWTGRGVWGMIIETLTHTGSSRLGLNTSCDTITVPL